MVAWFPGVEPSRKQSPFYLQKVIEPTASAGMVQLILPGQWECGTRSVWSSTEEIGGWWGKTCGTWSNMFSRKLASASWSPSCFSKVLGGWNLQSHETSYLTYSPQLAGSQAVWPWPNLQRGHRPHVTPGSKFGSTDTVRMSPLVANSAPILSIIVFSWKAPCQASFCPLPWASSFFQENMIDDPKWMA